MKVRYLVGVLVLLNSMVFASQFDEEDTFDAKDVVPGRFLEGPNHKVASVAKNNGLQNSYIVETEYGHFDASGVIGLKIGIREADAMAYLGNLSKSTVFVEALKNAGVDSVKSVVSVFKMPVETIKSLPSGFKKLVKGYVKDTKRGLGATKRFFIGSDEIDPKEFRKLNYLMADSDREWAAKLNVDPYSANMTLRKAISNMSVVQFIGGLPVDFAIPMKYGIAVGVFEGIADEIYAQDAAALEKTNRRCLSRSGIKKVGTFFKAAYMTPTMHTMFCSAAGRLQGVANLQMFADQLVQSESFEESRFLLSTLGLLVWHHNELGELKSLLADGGLPYAETADAGLTLMLPGDYVMWTEDVASQIDQLTGTAAEAGLEPKSIWILGDVSKMARSELVTRKWRIHDRTNDMQVERIYFSGSVEQQISE